MPSRIDLTGCKFGRLTVISKLPSVKASPTSKAQSMWLCKCDCGREVPVRTSSLTTGHAKSCGCYKREAASKQGKSCATHHGSHTRLWNIYRGMLSRCYNPHSDMYHTYGALGITVCDEWKGHFDVFREWALKNGYDENAEFGKCTIDRIDVTKGYSPDNCRWTDVKTQQRNRRDTIYLTYKGVTKPLIEWSEEKNIPYGRMKYRLKQGWEAEEVLYGRNKTNDRRSVR